MLDHEQIEAFREADEALARAEKALLTGTARFRHIMPQDEVNVIKAGVFYRENARQLALEVLALHQERERAGEVAMSPGEPEAKYGAV